MTGDPVRVMLDRVAAAAAAAVDDVLEHAPSHWDLDQLIGNAYGAAGRAAADVFGDYLLWGNNPPPPPAPRPAPFLPTTAAPPVLSPATLERIAARAHR